MTKRIVLFFLLVLLLTALIGGLLAYYQRKNQWEKEKTRVKNLKREELTIRLVEGWNLLDIAKYLEEKQLVRSKDFINFTKVYNTENYKLISQKPAKSSLEGFIFPDTYKIYKQSEKFASSTLTEIVTKSLNNFEKKIDSEMREKLKASKLNFYEIITLASIVENETGRNVVTDLQKSMLEEERKTIAGIFYNRLDLNMPLQSDATINYITGKNHPSPAINDLKIKSPYNTYLNQGLPPGPISNPSLSSIKAVLEPIKTKYLYFLHSQPDGKVYYSETHEGHILNKNKYLK